MEATEQILSIITSSGKPIRPGEIAEISGIDKKAIEKIIKKLVVEGKVYSPVRCFYDVIR